PLRLLRPRSRCAGGEHPRQPERVRHADARRGPCARRGLRPGPFRASSPVLRLVRRPGRRAGRPRWRAQSFGAHALRRTPELTQDRGPTMRFIRLRNDPAGPPRTGLQVGDEVYDLSTRFARAADFFAACPNGWGEDAINLEGLARRPFDSVKLLPPVDDGAGLYFVGANYKKHAEEAGLDVPGTPVIFSKPSTALVASGDPIMLSPVSSQLDYEGELAVIIGRRATRVSSADAPKHVAGFTIANDVTA